MRIIAQRVLDASVTVEEKIISQIGRGLLVLVGFTKGDNADVIKDFANKTVNMRLWDCQGKAWSSSVKDINGEILVVSQFTLYGYFKKGNKPDFHHALEADEARKLYGVYVDMLKDIMGKDKVQTGQFQAKMIVRSANEGPVTLLHERQQQEKQVIEARIAQKKQKHQSKKKQVKNTEEKIQTSAEVQKKEAQIETEKSQTENK